MKIFLLRYNNRPIILVLCFLLLSQSSFAQIEDDLGAEIEKHEQEMTVLEKQITVNSTSGNSAANVALEQKIKEHNDKIIDLLNQIKQIKSKAVKNSDEVELVALQKELQVMEDIVADLEKEIGTLNKEIQRLTLQGGGSVEVENLEKKVAKLQNENQILKQQIAGYRKNSNAVSNSNSGNSTQVTRLKGQVKLLQMKNQQLQVQVNNGGTRNRLHDKHFLKQYRSINTTNWVLGYRYTILPNINFQVAPSLLQKTKKVGTILAINKLSASGHYGFMGFEFLFHGRGLGTNIGLTANYAYNEGIDIKMQTAYFQLSGEWTILPIRLGLKLGVNGGYTFGEILNHNALLDDHTIQVDPQFSTFMVGFDAKARFYLSRYIAFAGYFGADYALSDQFKTDSWNTMFRYGIGIDFIIPLKKT